VLKKREFFNLLRITFCILAFIYILYQKNEIREDVAAKRVEKLQNCRKRSAEEFLDTDERRDAADVVVKRA
jgi:hypothetical protein